jgi:tRNA-splicing ligase RtcB
MKIDLKKINNYQWMISRAGSMRVPGIVFSSQNLNKYIEKDQSLQQVANVATLPGIVGYSLAMPDIHWGYGFPIGGVAAFDQDEGIISPGGVGYDINCGCRVATTLLKADDIKPRMRELVQALFNHIPSGLGSRGSVSLSQKEILKVATQGAQWAIKNGFGQMEDLEKTEDHGIMKEADPSVLSQRAITRGLDQLGTLGSGNHFLEIQVVDQIYDPNKARLFHLFEGQATLFIHSGSRGFGYQICDDSLKEMVRTSTQQNIQLPDRQLACAYLKSEAGRKYFSAMACAANYAWANRQILMHLAYETLLKTLDLTPRELGMQLLYDVSHNIAKNETHIIEGKSRQLCVHRKGATRSLPPGHPQVPQIYQTAGQPVLIPGDMGTCSYILAGHPGALEKSFGSTCHGAGRVLSRSQALKIARGRSINRELEDKGIYVQSQGIKTLKEEIPEAYKDVSQVVEVVHEAGLAKKVARLRPLGVIKG